MIPSVIAEVTAGSPLRGDVGVRGRGGSGRAAQSDAFGLEAGLGERNCCFGVTCRVMGERGVGAPDEGREVRMSHLVQPVARELRVGERSIGVPLGELQPCPGFEQPDAWMSRGGVSPSPTHAR